MKYWLAAAAVGAAAAAGCSHPGHGSESGAVLLQRAEAATSRTDFEGLMESRTRTPGGWRVEQVKVSSDKHGLSRLDFKSAPMAGMTEVQGQGFAWTYDPFAHKVLVTRGALPKRWSLIQQNYRVVSGPHVSVAGREAIQVDVVPQHPGNPWDRFWVDRQTHIVLGHEHYRSDGKMCSSSQFKSVVFKPVPESLFNPPRTYPTATVPMKLARPMSLADLQREVGFPLAMPRWIPEGYQPEGHFLTRCEDGCGAPVALVRYTDGLNTISLFESTHITDPTGVYNTNKTRSIQEVRVVRNNMDYALVGDVDPVQLRKMIDSIPQLPPAQRQKA